MKRIVITLAAARCGMATKQRRTKPLALSVRDMDKFWKPTNVGTAMVGILDTVIEL